MKKGFLVDKDGRIKISWIWTTKDKCPFPECLKLENGDIAYEDDDTDIEYYHDNFHIHQGSYKMVNGEIVNKYDGKKLNLNHKVKK